jgi:tetratricopeptide (TPR) repeat protein
LTPTRRIFIAAISTLLGLSAQASQARSDGSFPKKGSYTAWVNANKFLKFGNDFASKGDYDKALECYRKAIHTYEYDSVFYFNVGNAFSQKAQYSIAEESYRKAIELEPDYFQAWLNLGHSIARQARPMEAAKTLRHAAELAQNPEEKAAIERQAKQFEELPSNEAPPAPGKEGKKKKPKKDKHKNADSSQVQDPAMQQQAR